MSAWRIVYMKAGDGDGTYPVYELVENGVTVGVECGIISDRALDTWWIGNPPPRQDHHRCDLT